MKLLLTVFVSCQLAAGHLLPPNYSLSSSSTSTSTTTTTTTTTTTSPNAFPSTTEEVSVMKRQAPLQTCPPLTAPSGTVNYMQANPNDLYAQGTTVTLSCQTGTVTGAMTSTCTSGTWQPPIGSCGGALGASNPLGISSFSASPSPMGLGSSPLGVPGSTGTTGALQCLDMLTPMNGQIKYGEIGLHPSGSRATLSCLPGYMVQGQNEATCTNGVWVPAAMGMCSMSSSGMTPIITPPPMG